MEPSKTPLIQSPHRAEYVGIPNYLPTIIPCAAACCDMIVSINSDDSPYTECYIDNLFTCFLDTSLTQWQGSRVALLSTPSIVALAPYFFAMHSCKYLQVHGKRKPSYYVFTTFGSTPVPRKSTLIRPDPACAPSAPPRLSTGCAPGWHNWTQPNWVSQPMKAAYTPLASLPQWPWSYPAHRYTWSCSLGAEIFLV